VGLNFFFPFFLPMPCLSYWLIVSSEQTTSGGSGGGSRV
jgi:hypothetical protein